MSHPYQKIIDQCLDSVRSVKPLIKDYQYEDAIDTISNHNEWLLGVETVIDWLTESDSTISLSQFDHFKKAYEMMSRLDDSKIESLKKLIR